MDIRLRWFTSSDAEDCAYIDGYLTREQILKAKTPDNTICLIAETLDCQVQGYALYKVEKKAVCVIRLAVEKSSRRLGVASQLLNRLICATKQVLIYCDVPERALDLQLFFKTHEFRCVSTNSRDGTYRFERSI